MVIRFLQSLLLNALSICPVYHIGGAVGKGCTFEFKHVCAFCLSHHLSPFTKRGSATELCSYLVLFGCVFAGAS